METPFGIDPEELENFEEEADDATEFEDSLTTALKTLLPSTEDLHGIMGKLNPQWEEQARKVGRLPGLPTQTKCAAIILGVAPVLAQVFLVYAVAEEQVAVPEALELYFQYGEAAGVDQKTLLDTVVLLTTLGILSTGTGSPTAQAAFEAATPGPLHTITAALTAPSFTLTVEKIGGLQPTLEALGIDFTEDPSMFARVSDQEDSA